MLWDNVGGNEAGCWLQCLGVYSEVWHISQLSVMPGKEESSQAMSCTTQVHQMPLKVWVHGGAECTSIFFGISVAVEQPECIKLWFYEHPGGPKGLPVPASKASHFSQNPPWFGQFSSLSQQSLNNLGQLAIYGRKRHKDRNSRSVPDRNFLIHREWQNTIFIIGRCSSTASYNTGGFTVWKDQVLHLYHLNQVGLNANAFSSCIFP